MPMELGWRCWSCRKGTCPKEIWRGTEDGNTDLKGQADAQLASRSLEAQI